MNTAIVIEETVHYPIPVETNFDEENEFYHDQRLVNLAGDLIDRYPHLFAHLLNEKVAYLWKAKGPKRRDGSKVLGKTSKANSLLQHFGEVKWVVWLAAEACWEYDFTDKEVEATLFHELLHLQYNPDNGETYLAHHDVEAFVEEIKEYGTWKADLDRMKKAMIQLGLFKVA